MRRPDPYDKRVAGSIGRLAIGLGVLAAGVALYLLVPSEEEGRLAERVRETARASAPLEIPPRTDGVRAPDGQGQIVVPAAVLSKGEPIEIEIALSVEELDDDPMEVSVRTAGRSHALGTVQANPVTGAVRLSVPVELLSEGEALLAIRTGQASWNPHRRVLIRVAEEPSE